MKLPKEFATWNEILSLFPDDIAQLLSNIAKQLSPLITSISKDELLGNVEPDGFAGLTTKANYERLLLTEWGLRDHFPDEFIRRAASNEHLFLELQRVEHKDNRQCYALFDCGPKQLGRPRLVQLVVLILLARRAAKAGVKFYWGVLQDSEHTIYDEISKESIKAWLEHRTAKSVEQSDINDWLFIIRESLEQTDLKIDDLWLVSPDDVNAVEPQKVKIHEPLLDVEKIEVAIEFKAKTKSLSLKLNDEALNVRTIRDPFGDIKKQTYLTTENHIGQWVVGVSGLRLACLNSVGKIALYSLNKQKLVKPVPQQIINLNPDRKFAGAFVSKKMVVLVSHDDAYLYIEHHQNSKRNRKIPKPDFMELSDKGLTKIIVARGNSKAYLFILDITGNVICLNLLNENSELTLYKEGVIALGQSVSCAWLIFNDNHSYKNLENPNYKLEWHLGNSPVNELIGHEEIGNEQQVFSHGSGVWNKMSTGPFAIHISNNDWEVSNGTVQLGKTNKISIGLNEQVLGVIGVKSGAIEAIKIDRYSTKAVLIVLEEDKRSIRAIWDEGKQNLLVLESDFKIGEINPQHPILHYLDDNGDLLAVNLLTKKIIFELGRGELK